LPKYFRKGDIIKKLLLIIVFLLPISIRSFVVNNQDFFFNDEEKQTEINYIVHLSDKNLSLDLEDYIIGVVSAEMPALFEEEALKAQAIAARSFALNKAKGNKITITSTINDQVFYDKEELTKRWQNDYDKYYKRITNAVKATERKVIKRDDKILRTYYFAMSNGFTKDSQVVFGETTFKGVKSKWDNEELNNFIYEKSFTAEEILKALGLPFQTLNFNTIKRHPTNHVDKITVNNKEYTGIDFRHRLGLRSTDFNINLIGNNYLIVTKGYGHGVGMSQWGANGMAKEGYKYLDILQHYYQNVEIVNI